MRKIKKVNLNQTHFLSSEEMVKLNGGEPLVASCNSNTLGQKCVTTVNGNTYSGTCKVETYYSSDGTSSSSSVSYFCYAEY